MIKHIVFFKFKENTTEKEIREFEKNLQPLPASIDEIRHFEFGRDVIRSERSFDIALIVDFEDLDAGERYQKHPAHLKVIEKARNICSDIKAVDYKFQ
jgi:hypothetical protein